MNRASILLPALALSVALAACSSEPTVKAENASVAEVKAQIDEAGGAKVFLSPGRWESTMTMTRIAIPGMPPQIAERMQKAMASKTASTCLTPEEAKKPAADFFAGKERQGCRYDHFRMGDGSLDAKMVCGGQSGSAVIALKGTYAPDTYHVAMTVDGKGVPNAPQGAISMAMTVESRRTGECTGKDG